MSFNDKLSYTEHSVVSPTSDFTIGFEDYALTTKDRINVTVDDIDAKEAGYTVTRKSNLVVTLTPPVPNGVVRLQRETNIDTPFHRFTAGAKFVATNVDQNFTQILHSQQEVRNLFGFTQDYIQRTLDNFDLRIQGVEDLVLDLRQDYETLNLGLSKEIAARKQGDQDLKHYIDTTINGITGENFLPITDLFVTTAYGRTQHDKNLDSLSLYDFGYIGDGVLHTLQELVTGGKFTGLSGIQVVYPSAVSLTESIDSVAVQTAIDHCYAQGKTTFVNVPSGVSIHNKELIWRSYAYLQGVNYHDTVFMKAVDFDGRLVVSANFDSITGTDASLTGLPIVNFGIVGIKFDGQYIKDDTYVNNFGKGNIFIYGTKYTLDIKSINTDGVGVWLEYSGNENFDKDIIRDATVNLTIYDTAEEGLIFKGAPDVMVNKVIQKGAGKITTTDSRNLTLWSSKTYPNLGRLDGVVFDKGVEIGIVHAFGNGVGYGLRLESGRINANLLISESNLGGLDVGLAVYGLVSKVQVHNIKGGITYTTVRDVSAGTFPNVKLQSNQGFTITSLRSDHSGSGQTGQNHIHITGFNNTITTARINGYGKGGHALYFDAASFGNTVSTLVVNNIVGLSGYDSTASAAIVRNSNNAIRSNYVPMCTVTTVPVGLRTIGTNPRVELFNVVGTGVGTAFDGVLKVNSGQKWTFDIVDTTTTVRSSEFVGSVLFDPTVLGVQTISIAHNLIYTPPIQNIQLSMWDTPTSLSTAEIQYYHVVAVTASNIEIAVAIKVANTVNTSPYIAVSVKL